MFGVSIIFQNGLIGMNGQLQKSNQSIDNESDQYSIEHWVMNTDRGLEEQCSSIYYKDNSLNETAFQSVIADQSLYSGFSTSVIEDIIQKVNISPPAGIY